MKEEVEFIKKLQKIIVNKIGLGNISYCFCGSGFKYEECCKTNKVENSWFMDEDFKQFLGQNEDIVSRKDEIEKQKFKPLLIKGLYQQLENYGRLKGTCISPSCKKNAIFSHLIPKNFIKTLQKQGYKFEITGIDKELGVDSFATKLWCNLHDRDLFKETDKIGDIADLFDVFTEENKNPNRDRLLGELFFKILSFKVKTLILDQMYYFVGMSLSIYRSKEIKEKLFESFLNNYSKYNQILEYFDSLFVINNGNKSIDIPYLVGKSGKVTNLFNEGKIYYQTNIKMIGNTPLFINNILKNGYWIYFIGTTVEHSLDLHGKEIVNQIHNKLSEYTKSKDIKGALDYVDDLLTNESIYYLNMDKGFYGHTYIFGSK